MSNAAYYKFEADFISAIMSGEPDVVRGALAGAIRSCHSANIVRDLYPRLMDSAEPGSKFLDLLERVQSA